ncbi:hypothetical protein D9M71_579860 [compost metagenome]
MVGFKPALPLKHLNIALNETVLIQGLSAGQLFSYLGATKRCQMLDGERHFLVERGARLAVHHIQIKIIVFKLSVIRTGGEP